MNEFNKLAWEIFKKSGSISSYLMYSATKTEDEDITVGKNLL